MSGQIGNRRSVGVEEAGEVNLLINDDMKYMGIGFTIQFKLQTQELFIFYSEFFFAGPKGEIS